MENPDINQIGHPERNALKRKSLKTVKKHYSTLMILYITLDTYADVFDRMHTDSVEKFDTLMEQLERSMKGK